ncbi:hypothetical protein MKX03_012077 [Papaver bracteatum]|nr:hypothetical protein MKX03_012077 [Papaver bracteatum]
MAGTPRLIMAFLFICTLVASNTLMCTATACEALCSRLLGQLFETDDAKRGRCSADNDQPGQPMVCACC